LDAAALAVDAVEERMLGERSDTRRARLARSLASCIDALSG
jgi:hypothetical protein